MNIIKDEITGNLVTINRYNSISETRQILINMIFNNCVDCHNCYDQHDF